MAKIPQPKKPKIEPAISESRGSLWRRWDPHIHTPESALENGFGGWDEYIDALEERGKDVAVIGITDYCTLEGYKKVLEYRQAGRLSQFNMVFPNIEFRITPELSGGGAINLHLLIDPKDPRHVEETERALRLLTCKYDGTDYACHPDELRRLGTAHDPKQTDPHGALGHGINVFKPEFGVFEKWYASQAWLRENSVVVMANGKDGLGGLSKDSGFTGVREEMYRFSDLLFSANPTDREYFLGKKSDSPDEVVRKHGSLKACIHGSDAHAIDKLFEPDGQRYCWIKADPTFEGLRQVMDEPEDRVYIGPTVPTPIDESKIIDSIELIDGEEWFKDSSIPLNPGLVGIIGEKGSGKTALAELIAFGANAWQKSAGSSSFIGKARPLIGEMSVRLKWRDGSVSEAIKLEDDPSGELPSVRYLSQDFVEQLCSQDISGGQLITQIEEVIFTHIEESDRLDTASFEELKRLKTETIQTRKTEIKARIAKLNSEIVELEDQVKGKTAKQQQLKKCETDIAAIDLQLPTLQGSVDATVAKEIEKLSTLLQSKTTELANVNRNIRLVETAREATRAYEQGLGEAFDELEEKLKEAGLSAIEIDAYSPKLKTGREKPFERISAELTRNAEALRGNPKKLVAKGETIADLTARIAESKKLLATDEKQRERLLALQEQKTKTTAEKQRLEKEIEKIDGPVLETLTKKRASRMKTYLSYFDLLDAEATALKELYEPLEKVIAEDPTGAKAGFELSVQPVVTGEEWLDAGRSLFDGRKKVATLHDKEKVKSLETSLYSKWLQRDQKGIEAGLMAVSQDIAKEPTDIDGLLLAHANRESVYGWLFNTDHVGLEYGLRYGGTDLNVLSPGTRGIVLLVLYLAMDTQDNRPLVIDQPEGNLDNSSVYESLVPFLRKAKKTRQIILVTHNPNLVITTDADQVIVAKAGRSEGAKHPTLSYVGGSLENSGTKDAIREQAIRLLEGGSVPFKKRGRRYGSSVG
ncbi:MAG TPA: hypothetical protein VJH94_00250 [Candidatus Paceibacterota bacterium]